MKPITHVYLAAPYTSDPSVNTDLARQAGRALFIAGYLPVVPHLACQFIGEAFGYEAAMVLCFALLDRCDALVRLPGESAGADREVARAVAMGLPVFAGVEAFLRDAPHPVAVTEANG